MEPRRLPTGHVTPVRLSWWDGQFALEDPAFSLSLGDDVEIRNVRQVDTRGHVLSFDAVIAPGAPTGPVHMHLEGPGELDVRSGRIGFVTTPLPSAGDCQSALDEGQLPDGTYTGSYTGLEPIGFDPSFGCHFGDPEAGEQVIPLHLEAGQTLRAELITRAFGALYIARACELEEAFECAFRETLESPVVLRYTAEVEEDILLVVDAYTQGEQPGGGDAPYLVDIRRGEPVPMTVYPEAITSDGEEILEVYAIEGGFDPETANFDLGPDIEVLNVEYPEGPGGFLAEITAQVGDVRVPTRTPVTATLSDGRRVSSPEAFEIQPWTGTIPSCEIADFVDPLTVNGGYVGSTDLGNAMLDPQLVCPSGASGLESVFRVALGPSETLRARVEMAGDADVVLYVMEDCLRPPLVCSDIGAQGRPEYVEWTGPAEPSSVYLVIDGFDFPDFGTFYLQVEVGP